MKFHSKVCDKCRSSILLGKTQAGKWMALDPIPVPGGSYDYVHATQEVKFIPPALRVSRGKTLPFHFPHQATCQRGEIQRPPTMFEQ